MLTLAAPGWRDVAVPRPPGREHYVAFATERWLILYGGAGGGAGAFSDTWALELELGAWQRLAVPGPQARSFNADGGGGGVLLDGLGRRWLVVYGGLRGEGFRDNETWKLGPLEEPLEAWRWHEVQPGFGPQSRLRPMPRFHHTQTVLQGSTLAVLGGHNFMMRPILQPALLTLRGDETWELLEARGAPPSRAYHCAACWRSRLVVFGGMAPRAFGPSRRAL